MEPGKPIPAAGRALLSHKRLAFAAALFCFALACRWPYCTDAPFTSDSADYIKASERGIWSQYTGSDTTSVMEFYKRYQGDPEFREMPWRALYQESDGAAFRHFHVPASFYLTSLAIDLGATHSQQRRVVAAIGSLTIAMIFGGLCEAGVPTSIALLAGLLLSICPVLVYASADPSPHPLFSAASLCCLWALCRWLESRQPWHLAAFGIAFSLSIATLELSPVLFVAVALAVGLATWQGRGLDARAVFRPFLQFGGAVVVLLFLLWPGGFLKGGYLLSYGTFIFQALFRSASYFPNRSPAQTLTRLGEGSLIAGVVYCLGLAAALYVAYRVKREDILLPAFTAFAVLLLAQGLGNGFSNATYASHFVYAVTASTALASWRFFTLRQRRLRIPVMVSATGTRAEGAAPASL